MAHNYIEDMLDHLRRIKRNNVRIDHIETLEMELRFFRTFIKYYHVLPPDSVIKITKKAKLIVEMFHSIFGGIPDECRTNLSLETIESQLLVFVQGNTILSYNYELKHSYLPEYMDCLGKNINDVVICLEWNRSDCSLTNKEILEINRFIKQLKIFQKKMRFLRYLYVSEINGYIDHEKLEGLETGIQFMADNVGQLCFSFWVYGYEEDENDKDEDDDDILSKIPYLLFLVVIVELEMQQIFLGELKASKFSQSRTFKDKKLPKGFSHNLRNLLVYLRNEKLKNFPTNVTARNIDVAIEFLLVFLGDVPNRVINGKRLHEVLEKIGGLVGNILCVIIQMQLLAGSTINDDASKIDLGTTQILEKIEDLKAQVEERYYKSLKYSPSQFPTVGGLSFLDCFLRKLNEMLKSESTLDLMMKPHLGILEKELSSLTSVFRDVAKLQHKHDEILKDLQRRTIKLAYEAEAYIDSIIVQYNALWHFFGSLPATIKEIKHICAKVTEMRFQNLSLKPSFVVESTKHLPTQHSNPVNDEEIVGFENEAEQLIDYLTRGTRELDVIPIVGMGGQGKTTIARKVYTDKKIVSHFDRLAWCFISQTYNQIELLKEICSQVPSSEDSVDRDDELADILRKRLMGRRYLIVLDDMWDVTAWEDLMLSFPNGENRSRIIVTTRLENVGKQVKYHTDPFSLPFLPLDESCKLLQKKVFQQEGFPPELQDVSLAIAKKCKGLPLVIILVAGIIRRNKMEASWWHEVKISLLSYLGASEEYSLSTMQLSYDNLPDYLKPCLLYMGMFPEDVRIPVSQLINLWIAEGFVQNIESGRLEEVAEGYLMDLISSNVVMVSKRRYNGNVKYCQVHDVVLHFCLERSREERFMLAVKGHYSQLQPYDWNKSRVNFNFTYELSKIALPGSKTRKPFQQYLRSLIMTNLGKAYDLNQFSKLKLLKVLDLSSTDVGPLSSATLKPLIHLKYLAVDTYEFHFHLESYLPHLETLIVKGSSMPAVLPGIVLTVIFWKMEKLRHVEITDSFNLYLENKEQRIFEESSKLENLRILRNIEFPIGDADSMEVLLRRCPNLQQLYITFWRDDDSAKPFCLKLEDLSQLQVLHLSVCSFRTVSKLQLPSNLKKLVLQGTHIESTISVIAGLPSLEYLQLQSSNSFQSDEWYLGDITFHKLKFLKLVKLRISRWDASEESFPLLETLVISGCRKLEEIPLSFADIPTLKQIKLFGFPKESLEASAVRIKEEVADIEGCDRVNLIIENEYGDFQQL